MMILILQGVKAKSSVYC